MNLENSHSSGLYHNRIFQFSFLEPLVTRNLMKLQGKVDKVLSSFLWAIFESEHHFETFDSTQKWCSMKPLKIKNLVLIHELVKSEIIDSWISFRSILYWLCFSSDPLGYETLHVKNQLPSIFYFRLVHLGPLAPFLGVILSYNFIITGNLTQTVELQIRNFTKAVFYLGTSKVTFVKEKTHSFDLIF